MALQGISARIVKSEPFRIVLRLARDTVIYEPADKDTARKVENTLKARAVAQKIDDAMPEIFIRKNRLRDGKQTFAIATGQEPAVWPEDAVEI